MDPVKASYAVSVELYVFWSKVNKFTTFSGWVKVKSTGLVKVSKILQFWVKVSKIQSGESE
jgi:hypothetical protein